MTDYTMHLVAYTNKTHMRGNLSNYANTDKALSHLLRHGLLAANVPLL